VRIYPVEHPVEESVNLRDERVVVERRPTRNYAPDAKDFAPRELDVVERHERPVVGKKVRATEEVINRKDAKERRETVRDTVRETKVDIDKRSTPSRRAG
jgi:stress response protein YsnF